MNAHAGYLAINQKTTAFYPRRRGHNLLTCGVRRYIERPEAITLKSYIWRESDTPESVSTRLGLSPAALLAANPGVCFDALNPGAKIALPTPGVGCPDSGLHVVLYGQSIFTIARILGVAPLSLINANPYVDPSALVEGEVLVAPEREFCYSRYGDGLISISCRYGVPLWRLAELNPYAGDGVLAPGMRLRLS